MRIGVLSDLHCELQPAGSRWLNAFATEQLDAMTDAALAWFAAEKIDLLLVLGDVVQIADLRDLEHVFTRLEVANVAPLVAVNGNHDVRLGEGFESSARAHGIGLLYEHPIDVGSVEVGGVEISRGPRPPQYLGAPGEWGSGGEIVVVASHFPILSEASRVAGAGIPYAGDLVNRAELELHCLSDRRPTILLSGHIHTRCTSHVGTLLQFCVGAVIEPPYDATIVDVDPAGLQIRRTSRRLGPVAPFDPVLVGDEESWRWDGQWEELNQRRR